MAGKVGHIGQRAFLGLPAVSIAFTNEDGRFSTTIWNHIDVHSLTIGKKRKKLIEIPRILSPLREQTQHDGSAGGGLIGPLPFLRMIYPHAHRPYLSPPDEPSCGGAAAYLCLRLDTPLHVYRMQTAAEETDLKTPNYAYFVRLRPGNFSLGIAPEGDVELVFKNGTNIGPSVVRIKKDHH